MIGQHLMLRCTKGVYDDSSSPGFRTAAVSESIAAFPRQAQLNLNRIVMNYGGVSDSVRAGQGNSPRGILRVIVYSDMIFAIRTFRCSDLCDGRGDVSFVHTYIFTDGGARMDRTYILEHPEVLTRRESFDVYEKAARRSGGLSGGNPVLIDDKLIMPLPTTLDPGEVLRRAGMRQDDFVQLINALAMRISRGGWTALLLPGITARDWDESEGSLLGEQVLAAIMKLLPACLRGFFSGVSYWNEIPSDKHLQDIQLRILSGSSQTGLDEDEVSLVDLQRGEIRIGTVQSDGTFGSYLWEIASDPGALRQFHLFFADMFGTEVDRLLKMPRLMDALTQLFFVRIGRETDWEALLKTLLEQLEKQLKFFPALTLEITRLIGKICTLPKINRSLEQYLLRVACTPGTSALLGRGCVDYLLHAVECDDACPETIQYLAEGILEEGLTGGKKGSPLQEAFHTQLTKCTESDDLPAMTWLRMLITLYRDKRAGGEMVAGLEVVLRHVELVYREKRLAELCLSVCAARLTRCMDDRNIIAICETFRNMLPLTKESVRGEFCKAVQNRLVQLQQEDHIRKSVLMRRTLFSGPDALPPESPYYMPLFIQCLASACTLEMRREHTELELWTQQYRQLITDNKDIPHPPAELSDFPKDTRPLALYTIERIRIPMRADAHPDWKYTEQMLAETPADARLTQGFPWAWELITRVVDTYGNSEDDPEILNGYYRSIADSRFAYSFYLWLLDSGGREHDFAETVLRPRIFTSAESMDKLLETAESASQRRRLAETYTDAWLIWQIDVTLMRDDALTKAVAEEEKRLKNLPDDNLRRAIMQDFARMYRDLLNDPPKMVKAAPETLEFLAHCYYEYDWAGYFRRNQFLYFDQPGADSARYCNPQTLIAVCRMIRAGVPNPKEFYHAAEAYLKTPEPQRKPALGFAEELVRTWVKTADPNNERNLYTMSLLCIWLLLIEGKDWGRQYFEYAAIRERMDAAAPLFAVMGLEHIQAWREECIGVNTSRLDAIEPALVTKLESIITTGSSEVRQFILKKGCAKRYQDHVKSGLHPRWQHKLYSAVTSIPDKETREELDEYFKPQRQISRKNMQQLPLLLGCAAVFAVLLALFIRFIYLISPGVGLISSIVAFVSLFAGWLYITYRGEKTTGRKSWLRAWWEMRW